jgi:hypothetical protein
MLAAILELGAPTPGVDITLAFGPFTATVVVCDDDVVSVTCGPHHGQDALFRLLMVKPKGLRQIRRELPPNRDLQRPIGSGVALLARFETFMEELRRSAAPLGGLERRWAIHFPALKSILAGLPEDVKRVVRLADGTRDVGRLVAESPLHSEVTLRVLSKLLSAGALLRADIDDEGHVVADDNDGDAPSDDGISADRRWQRSNSSAVPSASSTSSPTPTAPPATTAQTATTSPKAKVTTTATTATPETTPVMLPSPQARAAAAAASTAASTAASASTASSSASAPVQASATKTAEETPITLDRHKVAGAQALPKSPPKPAAELSAWLGDEHSFFDSDAQAQAPTRPSAAMGTSPWWQLAILLAVGAVIGVVVARVLG